jgi:hypothetical protein
MLPRELLCHVGQRILIRVLLVHIPQLVGEGIQPPQELAGRDGLSRTPCQWLIEGQASQLRLLDNFRTTAWGHFGVDRRSRQPLDIGRRDSLIEIGYWGRGGCEEMVMRLEEEQRSKVQGPNRVSHRKTRWRRQPRARATTEILSSHFASTLHFTSLLHHLLRIQETCLANRWNCWKPEAIASTNKHCFKRTGMIWICEHVCIPSRLASDGLGARYEPRWTSISITFAGSR